MGTVGLFFGLWLGVFAVWIVGHIVIRRYDRVADRLLLGVLGGDSPRSPDVMDAYRTATSKGDFWAAFTRLVSYLLVAINLAVLVAAFRVVGDS